MIISISGTPATGKTSVGRELAKRMDAKLISIHALVRKKKIPSTFDRERKTKVVSIRDIRKCVKKEISRKRINIVEGHLSHFVDADIFVILRCRPDVLEKRMKKRGWPSKKIQENLKSELLDAVTIETVQTRMRNKILEIDASKKMPVSVAALIDRLIRKPGLRRNYRPGNIDWSTRYSKYLLESRYEMSA